MTSNAQRIANFLRKEMTMEKPSGSVVRFELRHLPVGSKRGSDVSSPYPVPEKADIAEFCEITSAEMVSAAESDAEGIAQGSQRYVVIVYRDKNPDKNVGRLAFVIAAPDADEEGEIESEPATKQGLQAMLMRHLEAKERIFAASQASTMQAMARMINSVTEENHRLQQERIDTLRVIEDAQTQRHIRELETKESEARTKMIEEGISGLTKLLPVVINRVAGGKPETKMLVASSLLDSFTDEQKAKLLQAFGSLDLTPEQQAAAMELFQTANH